MFHSIKAFFLAEFENEVIDKDHLIQKATAALLIEISRSDSEVQKSERELINKTIKTEFSLEQSEADELIETADAEVDGAVSLYEFTRVLNDHLSLEERSRIVELLWRVAFADSVLDKYEEYYVRKIADLLYVPQSEYIKVKHRALETAPN